MMDKFRKAIALLMSVCLLASASLALAEATTTDAAPEVTEAVATTPTFADTDVVAVVNGTDITWADVSPLYDGLISYYGAPDETSLELYYAVAMEEAVTMSLVHSTAAANGLDQLTQEELDAVNAKADADWQTALDNYTTSQGGITADSTEDQKTAAYADAVAYFATLGYDQDKLRKSYLDSELYTRVQTWVCKDITVSDEDVQAQYDTNVANDQTLYENDTDAYEYQVMLYQNNYASELPWYHPAGFRYVKHILLPVDATLMSTYQDLTARLEEQMSAESDATGATQEDTEAVATDTPDPSATPEPTQEPVSQAQVDQAKADILASIETTTTEIYDKIAQGADFDELIAQYAVDADGNPTDQGMTSGSYPNGYEVAMASTSYVPEFVEAAFSVDNVGDVSAPYISSYGVHIVKYMSDVPAGPVELTDALKESIRTSLLDTKTSDAMNAWQAAADTQYTGLIKSYDQLQAEDAAATDAATTDAATTDAPATTDSTTAQ